MFDSIYQIMKSGSVIGMFLEVVPITCLVGLIYAIYRFAKIKKHKLSVVWGTEIMRWLFVCYLTGLINLILVPSNLWGCIWFFLKNGYKGADLYPLFSGSFNFVPTLIKVFTGELTVGRWVQTMLTGNFLMFVPMGFFPAVCFRKNQHTKHSENLRCYPDSCRSGAAYRWTQL